MTWSRSMFAAGAADMLKASPDAETVTVFKAPPLTCNAPALVVGHTSEVLYGVAGLGVDEATIPIVCVGPLEGEDVLDELVAIVRDVFEPGTDPPPGVQSVAATLERNMTPARIGGAELLTVAVVLTVRM